MNAGFACKNFKMMMRLGFYHALINSIKVVQIIGLNRAISVLYVILGKKYDLFAKMFFIFGKKLI